MTTMTFTLRPYAKPDDFAAVAALLNHVESEPITAEKLAEWEEKTPAEAIRYALSAVDETGKVIGWGDATRFPWLNPGKFWVYAVVDPAARRQGVGSALWESLERFAREQGATRIETEVRDHHPESRAWAEKRGFAFDRHRYESTLDLASFDDSRFAGVVDEVRAGGIRFYTVADEPGEATERKLYEFYKRTVLDIPGWDDKEYAPFEQWRKWVLESPDVPHDQIILAGDGERIAGVTTLQHVKATGAMYTGYTGVHPDYRGRKLALAVKLLAVERARAAGAPYMRTNNDSKNAPMLAVNRKMGYVPSPGLFQLIKRYE